MAKLLRGPKRDELLKRYKQRVEAAKRHRDKDGYDALWRRLIDLYRGKHFETNLLSEQDKIAVNIAFSTINVIAPSVAVNYPKLVLWAQKPEDDSKASILEAVLNYWWRHFHFQPEFALAVKDYLTIGHGWLKVGWRYVEEDREVEDEVSDQDADENEEPPVGTGLLNGVGPTMKSPGSGDGAGTEPGAPSDRIAPNVKEPATNEVDTKIYVAEDRPFVERISPFEVFIDPEAKTLDDACWIAQKIVKPLEEVRNDSRYRSAARRDLKPDAQLNPDWRQDTDRIDDDIKRVTIWEFYDIKLGTMCVFSELGEELLLDPIPQPYAFGHPFVMLRNYEVPDFFYPMGDLEALEPLQLELDKTRSQMMNHRKRYNRKYLYNPTAFDAAGAGLLQTDQDNVMVPVLGNLPLAEAVMPLKQEAINPEFYNYTEGIEADLDRISGVSEYERGALPEIRRTATEASIIQDAANARASDKLAQIENAIARVAYRVVALAQQYLTQDQVARVIGSNGYPLWVPYGREDIQGEFDFEVEAGSTQPMNETARRQQAIQLLQTFSPYAEAGLVNAAELVKYALTFGFGVKNPDKFLMAQAPQPEQKQSPNEKLIETMNYKDAPPDIQRQIEAQAGFQPSQVGGSSPAEGHLAKLGGQFSSQAAAQQQQQAQHGHEANQEHGRRRHELGMAAHSAAVQHIQGEQQHQHAQEQAAQGAQHQAAQAVLGAALQPQPQGGEGEGSDQATQAPADPKLAALLSQLQGQVGLQQGTP